MQHGHVNVKHVGDIKQRKKNIKCAIYQATSAQKGSRDICLPFLRPRGSISCFLSCYETDTAHLFFTQQAKLKLTFRSSLNVE
jgi:hypothetical protein